MRRSSGEHNRKLGYVRSVGVGLYLCVWLAGCALNTSAIHVHSGEPMVAGETTTETDDVAISQLRQRTVAGILQGSALISSKVMHNSHWQYQFIFYDVAGEVLNLGHNSWVPLTLYGNEQRAVQSAAPNGQAVRFQLALRPIMNGQ
ncbi:MAG: DUF1425 domain-containing protein [Ferrimonas sp.]